MPRKPAEQLSGPQSSRHVRQGGDPCWSWWPCRGSLHDILHGSVMKQSDGCWPLDVNPYVSSDSKMVLECLCESTCAYMYMYMHVYMYMHMQHTYGYMYVCIYMYVNVSTRNAYRYCSRRIGAHLSFVEHKSTANRFYSCEIQTARLKKSSRS